MNSCTVAAAKALPGEFSYLFDNSRYPFCIYSFLTIAFQGSIRLRCSCCCPYSPYHLPPLEYFAMANSVVDLQIKEAESVLGVNHKLQILYTCLQDMHPFLQTYEGLCHRDESIEILMNQIKDLVYDAEDVIEDYLDYSIMYKKRKWTRYIPQPGKLSKRIREIKKRAVEIRAHQMEISAHLQISAVEIPAAPDISRWCSRRIPIDIVEEADVVGFTNEGKILVKRLLEVNSKRTVVSIVGMGGLGKTTLAKKIYNELSIKEEFQYRAWVHVSQENTSPKLMLGILKCFTRVTETLKAMNEEELGRELHDQLNGKKYLIVMDDVWQPRVWDTFKAIFPDDNNGSRIMFTTRKTEVALHADSDPTNPPHHLRFLSRDESWELFHKKALLGEICPPQWEELGRRTAEKCGGLPLAIVALGSLLSEKQGIFDEWPRVVNRVSSFLFKRSEEYTEVLALSYYELPYCLKQCFLYVSVFPEDHLIPARQLIQLWIAEGFIQASKDETMEDTAEKYLQVLVGRSLIQVIQRRWDGRVKTCTVHCLLREFCISEAGREALIQVHGSKNFPARINPRRLAGNNKSITEIHDNTDTIRKLRSLLYFSHTSEKMGERSLLFKKMRYLRVFKGLGLEVLPVEVENLSHLRYMGLSNDSTLQDPSSICNLFNLQVLDARSKNIISAPADIWKLHKLRHVYFEGATFLSQPPPSSWSSSSSSDDDDNSSSLKDLQTLSTISAKSCTSQVFQRLPNLRRLGIKGDLNEVSGDLVKLKHLHSLKLARVTRFPPLASLPRYFPPNLAKLTLCETQLDEDPMQILGKLLKLQSLKLSSNVYNGGKMVCSAHGFPQLRLLELVSLEHIPELIIKEGALPNLEHLVIHDCLSLLWLTGLSHLTSLQVVDLQRPTTRLRERMQKFNMSYPFQLHIYPL